MSICTYMDDNEAREPTSNKDLNDLLAQVREATGCDYRLRESLISSGILWWKKTEKVYSLYSTTVAPEVQLISWYKADQSFCTRVSADVIAGHFYGLINGVMIAERKAKS